MSDWVIDNRGGVCEQCGDQKQSLSLHWSKSASCSYPELGDQLREVIRGCMLGDGALDNPNDGAPALRIASVRARHIEWVHEQLKPLSRGVSKSGRDVYRLRTMSHPGLGIYWTWQGSPPDTGWSLTPTVARIWYACDGTLGWPGDSTNPRVAWTITDDQKREVVRKKLEKLRFDPMEWDDRLALRPLAADRWLDWLGDPPPGSEYKWATSREVYRRQRDAAQHQTIDGEIVD